MPQRQCDISHLLGASQLTVKNSLQKLSRVEVGEALAVGFVEELAVVSLGGPRQQGSMTLLGLGVGLLSAPLGSCETAGPPPPLTMDLPQGLCEGSLDWKLTPGPVPPTLGISAGQCGQHLKDSGGQTGVACFLGAWTREPVQPKCRGDWS